MKNAFIITTGLLATISFSGFSQSNPQLPNSSFDEWSQSGKLYFPYLEGTPVEKRPWTSANTKVFVVSNVGTFEETEHLAVKGPGKKAARLVSKYCGVGKSLGKFAAGNIFTGEFVKATTKPMGAELRWGVPFTAKPKALHGYYDYTPKVIDYAEAPHLDEKGKMDTGAILVLLTDWPEPYDIKTSTKKFVDYEGDPHIIAMGELILKENTGGYREFTLPLKYRNERTPKYIVIMCASSHYGDYFTGGSGSTLYVDELNLVY